MGFLLPYILCAVSVGLFHPGIRPVSGLREILDEAALGNLPKPTPLQAICQFSDEEAARYCLVSPETYRRWKNDRKPNKTPHANSVVSGRFIVIKIFYLELI